MPPVFTGSLNGAFELIRHLLKERVKATKTVRFIELSAFTFN
jgi:hypothetical protein